ncbi:MAG TPA: hypothetical protein VLA51_02270, partial [Paracoccaceae bacterium]|nr:hypothetical protein [Paracoccaceae bacterium]
MGKAKLVGHIRRSIFVASGFSIVRGVLILAGPLFMLQVYDRVLTSGSLPTLFSLLAITAAILCVAAILEIAARRVLQTAANNLRHSCGAIVVAEHLEKSNGSAGRVAAIAKVLEGGEIPTSVDLALLPFFLALLASFHPLLGATAVAILLFGLAIAGVHSFLQSQTRSVFLKAEIENQALLIDFQNNAEAL